MSDKDVVNYFSSNKGKYDFLSLMFSKQNDVSIKWIDSSDLNLYETNNPTLNAQRKALEGSKLNGGLILSSDDSLIFKEPELQIHPKANIYRDISGERVSEKIIHYYIQLIKKTNYNLVHAKLTSFYAIAVDGGLLGEFEYSYNMALKIPNHIDYLPNMPLSSLHFIEELNKYYTDLDIEEQYNYHISFIADFRSFYYALKHKLK